MVKKYLLIFLKGIGYGITNLVPAIGGGTILIALGIYEQFVDAFGNLLNYKRWKEIIPFLVALLAGAAVGMIGLSKLINMLLQPPYEAPTMFFFIGLLIATIPSVVRMHRDMRPTVGRVVALLVGVGIVVLLRFLGDNPALKGENMQITNAGSAIYYVVTSFLAGLASVTPGMDGSSVFMLARTYEPITGALGALAHLEIRWGIIIFTTLGAGPGIILSSRGISWAIKRAPALVYYCVIGIIASSVYGLWPASLAQSNLLIVIVLFVIGLVLGFVFNPPSKAAEAETTPAS